MGKRLFLFILIILILLVLRVGYFYLNKKPITNGQMVVFTTRILVEPRINKSFQNFSVQNKEGDTIFISTEILPEYSYGQEINISGNAEIKLLNDKSPIITMSNPKISYVKNRENDLLASANFIRQKIINSFRKTLPDNSSSLLLGIVFGIKENMSKDFSTNLKSVGVTHVIAASGMNVTLLAGFLFFIFTMFLKRQIGIILSIFAIIFYVFLSGFQPSIIRAAIMGIIAFSAQGLGKQNYSLYALFLTGSLMLFIIPDFLSDIGFQLSFLSTLGIISIPGLFKRFQNPFTEDFMTTVSAQIATLPILLLNFGNYSLWSIVVNVLVLWTVPILMILGGIAALVSFVFQPLASLFLYLCLPLLVYFEEVVNIFSSFSGRLTLESLPWQFVLAYYLILTSLIMFATKRNNE